MNALRLPATLKWSLMLSLLLLAVMTLFRVVLYQAYNLESESGVLIFLEGMLMDIGALSPMLGFFVLASLFPHLHPFKSRRGKKFSIVYFAVWGAVFACVYAFDISFIKMIHYRVYGGKFWSMFGDSGQLAIFRTAFPAGIAVTAITLICASWTLIVARSYRFIKDQGSKVKVGIRTSWQLSVMIACIFPMAFAIGDTLSLSKEELNILTYPVSALSSNPLWNFFIR